MKIFQLEVDRSSANRWLGFALFGVGIALFLMLRPIPSIYASNDTGRYVAELHYFCRGQLDDVGGQLRQMGRSLMYELTAACLFKAERFFLFIAALSFPAAFLCFSRWKAGDFIIAISAIMSVYGLELMSNALRSSLALFFFLGALRFGKEKLSWSSVLFIMSAILHSSMIIFFPILYFQWRGSEKRKLVNLATVLVVSGLGLYSLFNSSLLAAYFQEISSTGQTLTAIYDQEVNILFVSFITLPLLVIFYLRKLVDKSGMSKIEYITFYYCVLTIFVSYLIFPIVAYRFALVSVPIQLFAITQSEVRSVRSAKLILVALAIHLAIMVATSSYYQELLS